jgi:transcriptional antiterminator RfaH
VRTSARRDSAKRVASSLHRAQSPAADDFQSLLRWFLVLTKPAGDEQAQVNLERQGYKVYRPKLLRRSVRRGRWVEGIVSLFPRYLFVQLDTALQSLAPVRSTFGVTDIVRFGSSPTVVPDAVVADLVSRADPSSGLHRLAEDCPLERGSRVSVIGGTFAGLDGIFQRVAGDERVVVLLEILGRTTPVCIHSQLVAAGLKG